MIKIIRVDGSEETLESIPQDLAGIGMMLYGAKADLMEHVTILLDGKRAQMWVHENGKNIGFEYNAKATELYLAHHSAKVREAAIRDGCVIVGDALVLTGKDQLT